MVNSDVFIKYARNILGQKTEWPDIVKGMTRRLEYIKLGFPGIRSEHITLVPADKLVVGDIFILDSDLTGQVEDQDMPDSPVMLRILDMSGNCYVEGIGCGYDLRRDPTRTKIRWMDTINIPSIETYVYRVDVRPDFNGGPGYYYFYRSYRDFRY